MRRKFRAIFTDVSKVYKSLKFIKLFASILFPIRSNVLIPIKSTSARDEEALRYNSRDPVKRRGRSRETENRRREKIVAVFTLYTVFELENAQDVGVTRAAATREKPRSHQPRYMSGNSGLGRMAWIFTRNNAGKCCTRVTFR